EGGKGFGEKGMKGGLGGRVGGGRAVSSRRAAVTPRPFLRAFVAPATLCALGFVAALAAVMQYSLRGYVPGSVEPGGFPLANFAALLKPRYARVFLATVWICFLTALFTLIVGCPLAYALVHARNVALKSVIL